MIDRFALPDAMKLPTSGRTVMAVTVVAVSLIWLVGVFVPAHTSIDPMRWTPFPSDAASWTQVGAPDAATFDTGITLRSSAAGTNRLSLDVPLERPVGDDAWLMLSGRLVEETREGKSWATAAVGVAFVRASGETFDYRNIRFVPRRATTLERFSEVIEWPAGAVGAQLSLHSRPGAPAFSLVEGSAEFVQPNRVYALALVGLAGVVALWVAVTVGYARTRQAPGALLAPGLIALTILVGVTLSVDVLRPVVVPLLGALEGVLDVDPQRASFVLLKGGHALGFFLLTVCLFTLRRPFGLRRRHLAAFAGLLAIGSEGLQAHLSDRGASLSDVLIDLAGVAFAILILGTIGGERRRRARRRSAERRRRASDASSPAAELDADATGVVDGGPSAPGPSASPSALDASMSRGQLVLLPDIDLGSTVATPVPEQRTTTRRRRKSRRRGQRVFLG